MSTRVLVVDDNRLYRESFCAILAFCFAEVAIEAVEDVSSALRLLSEQPFDLLITDYQLKAYSGTQLIRQVRQHAANIGTPALPIVLMSTNPDMDVFARTLGVPFLHKPVDPEILVATLTPLLKPQEKR